jgi:hypothetical protein
VWAVGCDPGKPKAYPVTGKIVFKGTGEVATGLAGGYVCLQAVADSCNKPVGPIGDDGTFVLGTVVAGVNLGGVLPGEYRACVVPPTDTDTGQLRLGLIDSRFASFDQSGLRLTIVADKNDVTIEVEPPQLRSRCWRWRGRRCARRGSAGCRG